MTVMDTEYTQPSTSPSAVRRVEGHGGAAAHDDVVWSHIQTTSGLTEQEADEAELNNYLQTQECAVFTGYSSIIILNTNFLLFSLINVQFGKVPLKCLRHIWNKKFDVHI